MAFLPALSTVELFSICRALKRFFLPLFYMNKFLAILLRTYMQLLTLDLAQVTGAKQLKQVFQIKNRPFNDIKILTSTIPLLILYLFCNSTLCPVF